VFVAFELWFKQILYELDYICEVLEAKAAGDVIVLIEQHMATVLMRAERTHTILKFASNQFDILKTMPARAFNDFRVYLDTASGFQSVQFRRLEIQLGLDESRRVNSKPFTEALLPHEAEEIFVARSKKSLFQLVNNLLEETLAITEAGGFNFYGKLAAGFESKLSTLEFKLRQGLSIDIKKRIEEEIVMLGKLKRSLMCEETHREQMKIDKRRFSFKATQGALMILTYGTQSKFYLLFKFLQTLMSIDEALINYRQGHVSMVLGKIGFSSGTGGSSGVHYLSATCGTRYRIFMDLVRLNTYDIPKEVLPKLDKNLEHSTS